MAREYNDRTMSIVARDPGERGARSKDVDDLAKLIVIAEIARIIHEGKAVITTLESDTLELRLATGEIFHLRSETVTRIA
jgi:hypothetical protein